MTKNRFRRCDVSALECESRPGKSDFATLEIVSQVRFTGTVPEGRVELLTACHETDSNMSSRGGLFVKKPTVWSQSGSDFETTLVLANASHDIVQAMSVACGHRWTAISKSYCCLQTMFVHFKLS